MDTCRYLAWAKFQKIFSLMVLKKEIIEIMFVRLAQSASLRGISSSKNKMRIQNASDIHKIKIKATSTLLKRRHQTIYLRQESDIQQALSSVDFCSWRPQ